MSHLKPYIQNINTLYKTGKAREHSYRGDLQTLLNNIIDNQQTIVTNEPARIVNVGAPDYSITKKGIPIGYIEAKDIAKPLASADYEEQFKRYRDALDNLIITDYLDFWFYRNGTLTTKIQIAKVEDGQIKPIEENFLQFENLIKSFVSYISQSIKSPSTLAKMMAGKARLLENVLEKAITSDDDNNEANNSLKAQMDTFKNLLIHDITPSQFADIYAQTIAYGMFAGRYHDDTLDTFSREEAAALIPKSNPFLRSLFSYISGIECDDRIIWIIEELVEIFKATDVREILSDYGKNIGQDDPIIHFYETFLGEYNPALRKARGVWYTPQSVVNFIVRAVDEILKADFGLKDGLADTTKTKIKITDQSNTARNKKGELKQKEIEVHKVQILDPATGTGTFLAETIKHIHKSFVGMTGFWSKYVEDELMPRLNGFELLMASYAMAHLKLDLLLSESGYKPINPRRFNVFLTNSLEEAHPDTGTLFASWLSNESTQANKVKNESPVMVVIGNPPYAVSSSNKSKWITQLIADYKKDLNERKINLDDDYIKFIRYGQHFVDKNGEGMLAYISNNSFIDGITHRQMRKSLLESFDTIYIIDLHGNSKKKETAKDGSKDENVFDIMQGVSINIFVKTKTKSKTKATVYHTDIYGRRADKYSFLDANSLKSIKWNELVYSEPNYFFVPKDFGETQSYEKGFKLDELMPLNNTGIQTKCDELSIHFTKDTLESVINDFQQLSEIELKKIYGKENSSGWNYKNAIEDLRSNKIVFTKILYRPFDIRHSIFTGKSSGFIGRPRTETYKHFLKQNYGLITLRINGENNEFVSLITDIYCEKASLPRGNYSIFPLYLYTDETSLEKERTPNLNRDIVEQIAKALGIPFVNEKESGEASFASIDILDYIYAVLHSPAYREKYKEFLKIDFPRVPYPDPKSFWQLVSYGSELRTLHLLENPKCDSVLISYEGDGDNKITRKIVTKDTVITDGKVRLYINDTQYFDNIPLKAWEFYIGGYQPAQKWLKDRSGRSLTFDDIRRYFKIIATLIATDEMMKKIDTVLQNDG